MTEDIDCSGIAGRVADALRQAYGSRLRGTSWVTTQPKLLIDVELLGPLDFWTEMNRISDVTYDTVVEEAVTIICKPVEAGTVAKPSAIAVDDHRPNEKHVSRIAARLAEQLRDYHAPDWDYGDPDNRRLVWRAAKRIAEVEDQEIAAILGRDVRA